MTSFINAQYPVQHQGANRVASTLDAVQHVGGRFSSTRGLATLLLSAVAAAAMVVADQVMDTIAEGHLLMLWVALWMVAFTALAFFAGTARRIAARTKIGLDDWSRSLAQARADQHLWAIARHDDRVMADLQAAMSRSEAAPAPVAPAASVAASVEPEVKLTGFMSLAYTRTYI